MAKACEACRQKITFIKTTSGKNMPCELDPIDPTEAEDGETYITPEGRTLRFSSNNREHLEHEELYIPHWKFCENANQFRGKKV